jgi:arylsulfatase A-like enzyme
MAAGGAKLTNHYCAAPVCAPSRSSLLLGVSQGHANVRDNQFDKALQDTYTMSSVLKRAGYRTALVGKWGLQGETTHEPDWPAHPHNRGFDYSFAYIRHRDGHEHYPKEGIYRGAKEVWENKTNIADQLDKCYTTDLWTAAAKRWIAQTVQSNQKEPFFLCLAYDTPHAVLELPTQAYPQGGGLKGGLQWTGKPGQMITTATGTPDSFIHPDYANATYDDDNDPKTPEVAWPDTYKRYATSCRRIDDGVGDIITLLKDLKIDDNTMIVFMSDNGPSLESYLPDQFVPNEPTFFDSYGPFDGVKRDLWEGGVRMPTLVRWPGRIPSGQVVASPSASYDWLATFADAAGIAAPARLDGVSLLPELSKKGKRQESLVYIEYDQNGKTPDFKEFSPNHRSRKRNQMQKIRKGDLVGVRYDIAGADDDFEIYDVVADPQETKNLALEKKYAALQQEFKHRVLQVRRPDAEAKRPYDDALVPAVSPNGPIRAGVKWRSAAGEFPWVSALTDAKFTGKGVSASPDISKIKIPAGMVAYEGFLKIPEDGNYTFDMSADGGFILRIHEALVLDSSYGADAGARQSGDIKLAAGYHPFTIYYHKSSKAKGSLEFLCKKAGGSVVDSAGFFFFR